MTDYSNFPGIGEGHKAPYFPPTYEKPDCHFCERRETCTSCDKFQRDRRDFSYMSGRCPRLPNRRGFVEREERELYASIFPLVHAERGEDSVDLSLSIPGQKRLKKVYRSNGYGVWWFRDGYRIRHILDLEHNFQDEQEILDFMEKQNWDYCVFRCEILDQYF